MTVEEAAKIAEVTGVTVEEVITAARAVRQRAGPNEKMKRSRQCANTAGSK